MLPSLLPRGPRWWPEHPLEALGIQEPSGKSVAGEPDAKRPAGRGRGRQAGPWRRSVGLLVRPQVFSLLASEDAASCSDSSSLLGPELAGDWVSRAVNGAGLQARPAHRGQRLGLGSQGAAERGAGPAGGGGGAALSVLVPQRVEGALQTRTLALGGSPAGSLPRPGRPGAWCRERRDPVPPAEWGSQLLSRACRLAALGDGFQLWSPTSANKAQDLSGLCRNCGPRPVGRQQFGLALHSSTLCHLHHSQG